MCAQVQVSILLTTESYRYDCVGVYIFNAHTIFMYWLPPDILTSYEFCHPIEFSHINVRRIMGKSLMHFSNTESAASFNYIWGNRPLFSNVHEGFLFLFGQPDQPVRIGESMNYSTMFSSWPAIIRAWRCVFLKPVLTWCVCAGWVGVFCVGLCVSAI